MYVHCVAIHHISKNYKINNLTGSRFTKFLRNVKSTQPSLKNREGFTSLARGREVIIGWSNIFNVTTITAAACLLYFTVNQIMANVNWVFLLPFKIRDRQTSGANAPTLEDGQEVCSTFTQFESLKDQVHIQTNIFNLYFDIKSGILL